MSYTAMEEKIKSLPLSLQQNIESYIFSVIESYETNTKDTQKEENFSIEERRTRKLKALNEFAGSMQDFWKGIDILDYQGSLRKERNID